MPEMIPVVSSNVAAVGYESSTQTVYVRFSDGKMYIYKGVLEIDFENLKNAASIGSYLHRSFKNVYPYERVE